MTNPRMTPSQADLALATMTDDDFVTIDSADDIDETQLAHLIETAHRMVGRPSLTAPGRHSPALNLRLPETTKQRLVEVATARGVRQSTIVRQALEEYLAAA